MLWQPVEDRRIVEILLKLVPPPAVERAIILPERGTNVNAKHREPSSEQ
jgi:hypothetical protein